MARKLWLGGDSGGAGDWSIAANWSPSGVPVNSDEVWIDGAVSVENIDAGLDQSLVTLASLVVTKSYTGLVGTAAAYLQVGATECELGVRGSGISEAGSQRVKIDFGAVQTACVVHGSSANGADTGLEPMRLKGTHASNQLHVRGGIVGTGTEDQAEVTTWATVTQTGGKLRIGSGATLTTVSLGGGELINRGANLTTLNQSGGDYTALGGAIHTTINQSAGTSRWLSDGTITTLHCSGTFTSAADARAKTITNCSVYEGASLDLDTGNPLSVTLTNGVDLVRCGLEDVSLKLGRHLTLTPSAV